MLNILQKQYTLDLMDYVQCQDQIKYRSTLCGSLMYYFGKFLAICWIIRFLTVKYLIRKNIIV